MSWPDDPIAAVVHPDPYPYYAALAAEPMRRHERLGLLVAARPADVARRARERPAARAAAGGAGPARDRGRCRRRGVRSPRTHDRRAATGGRQARGARGARVGRSARGPSERSRTRRPPGRVSRSRAPALARDGGRLARARADDGGPRRPDAGRQRGGRGADAAPRRRLRGGRDGGCRGGERARRGVAARRAHGRRVCTARSRARRRRPGSTRRWVAANAVGFLSQTLEATAGLVGNALVAAGRSRAWLGKPADALVRHVLLHDPPVHNTRRFVAEPGTVAGVPVAPGDAILVVLAAAAVPFGAGRARLSRRRARGGAGRRHARGPAGQRASTRPRWRSPCGTARRRTCASRCSRKEDRHDGRPRGALPRPARRTRRCSSCRTPGTCSPRARSRTRASPPSARPASASPAPTACATARTRPGTRRSRPSRGWRRRCACRSRSTWRAGSAARRTTSRGARAALADAGAAGFNLEDGRADGTLEDVGPPARRDRRGARRAPGAFVNARCDVFWLAPDAGAPGLAQALERALRLRGRRRRRDLPARARRTGRDRRGRARARRPAERAGDAAHADGRGAARSRRPPAQHRDRARPARSSACCAASPASYGRTGPTATWRTRRATRRRTASRGYTPQAEPSR